MIETTDSLALAVIVTAIVQQLKTSPAGILTWISENNPWLVRLVAAFGAALVAAGMTWDYQTSGGVLTITGLTATNAASFIWITLKQFFLQEGYFRVAKRTIASPTS